VIDYQKDGIWKVYDETGKLTGEEKWVNGEEQKLN
jgi:antitoxin component YwqK of YwqJK toxin-antitoxin module